MLDRATARELGLRKGLKVVVDGVSAQVTGFWPQRLQASLGEIPLPRQYLALDLQELSQGCHRRLDGLLGMDFFRDRVVQVYYANQWLRILGGKASIPPGEELPLTIRHCGMLVPVSVGGAAPAFLRVDTGCASWLHWTTGKVNGSDCSSRVAVGLVKMSLWTC